MSLHASGTGEAVAELVAMRKESLRRTVLLCLITGIISSLILGTTWPDTLHNLILPVGLPVSHFVNAILLYILLCMALIAADSYRVQKILARGRPVSTPVARVIGAFVEKTGIPAEARGFGNLKADGLEAAIAGSRRVVWIGTLRERQSVTAPDTFEFAVAHEFAHLGGGDPRTDQIVKAAYATGVVFILCGIGRVLFSVIGDPLSLIHRGSDAVFFALRSGLPALIPNMMAFGTLAALLFAESRSAKRLREFHADAAAREWTGHPITVAANSSGLQRTGIGRLLDEMIADHPSIADRSLALQRAGAAFEADRILFLLQGYFAGTILEFSLQLLFVMASPGVSTLAMRSDYFATMLATYPIAIPGIIVIALIVLSLSHFLVLERFAMMARDAGRLSPSPKLLLQAVYLAAGGAVLALASSQTTYWELSHSGWSFGRFLQLDPDRPTLHLMLLLTSSISVFLVMTVQALTVRRGYRLLLAFMPSIVLLTIGAAFYH